MGVCVGGWGGVYVMCVRAFVRCVPPPHRGRTISTTALPTAELDTGLTATVTVRNTAASSSASTRYTGTADHTVMLFLTDDVRTITPE